MEYPVLYRKRIIPQECIRLKDDVVLSWDDDTILTKWKALHPKKDLHHGASCYFLKEGFKVSRFCYEDGSLLYWYCDIVDFDYNERENAMTVIDLLADVVVYPDGFVKVMDIGELSQAKEEGLISDALLVKSLYRLDRLLSLVYSGQFRQLQAVLENIGE